MSRLFSLSYRRVTFQMASSIVQIQCHKEKQETKEEKIYFGSELN